MNILINLSSSEKNNKDKFHGGNEYANRITKELIKNNNEYKHQLFILCNSRDFIDQDIKNLILSDNNSHLIENKNQNSLEVIISNNNIDKLFDPLGVFIGRHNLENIEVIYTIHGLRPLEIPTDINEYYLEDKIKFIIKSAFRKLYLKKLHESFRRDIELKTKKKKIVVVSEHTKNCILSEFKISPNDINVFYSPEKISPAVSELEENKFFVNHPEIKPNKYHLIVSSGRWIKNTYRAISAINELIIEKKLKNKIVLTGVSNQVRKLTKNFSSHYILLDYVESFDLEVLYKNAFALLYPSLNEGFGYPPIEAMKYRTPVIASLSSSIPEISGKAILGFNPFLYKEIKARIIQIENSSLLYQNLKLASEKQYDLVNKKQEEDLKQLINLLLN